MTNSTGVVAAKQDEPKADERWCFQCKGTGELPCLARCSGGTVSCPNTCLKLTSGSWIHMTVAGHDPNELWIKFPNSNGRGYQAWNQNHVGEIIAYAGGVAQNYGKCKTCGGTTKVTCATCKGTGKRKCELCEGKKIVPAVWSPTNNPWLDRQPDVIRLSDGRVLLGKVVLSSGDDRTIKTRENKIVHVSSAEIISSSGK